MQLRVLIERKFVCSNTKKNGVQFYDTIYTSFALKVCSEFTNTAKSHALDQYGHSFFQKKNLVSCSYFFTCFRVLAKPITTRLT